MSEMKNIFYECLDCKIKCKTKKEMINHIKEIRCENNKNKLEKKNKNKEEDKKNNNNENDFDYDYIMNNSKTNLQIKLYYKLKNDFNDIKNYFGGEEMNIFNPKYIEMINNEIPELNIKVNEKIFLSIDNFFNPEYIDYRLYYFLIDPLVIAFSVYYFNKNELNLFEKCSILYIIKNKYFFYTKMSDSELLDYKYYIPFTKYDYDLIKYFDNLTSKNTNKDEDTQSYISDSANKDDI